MWAAAPLLPAISPVEAIYVRLLPENGLMISSIPPRAPVAQLSEAPIDVLVIIIIPRLSKPR